MKRIINSCLTFFLLLFLSAACTHTDVRQVKLGDYVPLEVSLDKNLVLPGDVITYSISVLDPKHKGLSLNEDIEIQLRYLISKDGQELEIDPVEFFETYPKTLYLKRGLAASFAKIKVKKTLPSSVSTISIRAFSRGYSINGANKLLTLTDKIRTHVEIVGNSDNALNEGSKFQLRFSLPVPAEEDIKIRLHPTDVDKDKFIDLPEEVILRKGFKSVDTRVIILKAFAGENDFTHVAVNLSTEGERYPLLNETLQISVKDLDGNLDPTKKLTDERWVYSNPEIIFMSEKNAQDVEKWGKTKNLQLINPGDPHPNAALASQGWMLLNAMEFTPIPSLIRGGGPNEHGNLTCPFFADQNVANTQKVQAVNMNRYCHQTEEGYMMIWSAHDPGIKTTGGIAGQLRDYGVAALYQNKYDGANADGWGSSQVKILPGMRIEFRLRLRGELFGFNPAVWLQGNNFRSDQWSYYGEIDILEAPYMRNGKVGVFQTFHWNDNKSKAGDKYKPTTGKIDLDLEKFNIYWVEWRTNDEIAMGINGEELLKINRDPKYTWWPFTDEYNKNGMHLLITLAAQSNWALGDDVSDWDKYLKLIPYDGSKENPKTPRMEFDFIRYYKQNTYSYDPYANNKSYMY